MLNSVPPLNSSLVRILHLRKPPSFRLGGADKMR